MNQLNVFTAIGQLPGALPLQLHFHCTAFHHIAVRRQLAKVLDMAKMFDCEDTLYCC